MEKVKGFNADSNILFQQMQDMLVILDSDYHLVFTNEYFLKYTGYEKSQIIGSDFSDFLQDERKLNLREKLLSSFEEGSNRSFEIKFKAQNFIFDSEIHFSPFTESGKQYFGALIRDVTTMKSAVENLIKAAFRWRETFDLMLGLVCQIDTEGKIIRSNRKFAEIAGMKINQIIGCPIKEVLPVLGGKDFDKAVNDAAELNKRQYIEAAIKENIYEISVDPYYEDEDLFSGSIIILNDITYRVLARNALERSENRLKLALEGADESLWDIDLKARTSFFSPDFYNKLGYDMASTPSDFDYWKTNVHPDDMENVDRKFREIMEFKTYSIEFECRLRSFKGEWRTFSMKGKLIKGENGVTNNHIIGTLYDITYKKKLEYQVMIENKRLKYQIALNEIADKSEIEITGFALKCCLELSASKMGFIRINGPNEEELASFYCLDEKVNSRDVIEKNFTCDEKDMKAMTSIINSIKKSTIANSEPFIPDEIKKENGIFRDLFTPVYNQENIPLGDLWLFNKKEPYEVVDIIQLEQLMRYMWQIILQKRTSLDLIRSLHEKEVLLKEIHHRVKNNLYIIASLLELKIQTINNKDASEVLIESMNRIQSMAIIHEQLYSSETLSKIFIDDYLKQLGSKLLSNFTGKENIKLNIQAGNESRDINFMIPFGLIINEMITNSIKYAFKNNIDGWISIKVYQDEERSMILEYEDSGSGIPDSINFHKPETLGFQIINDLTLQLNGNVELIRSGGAHFIFHFPVSTNLKTYSNIKN